VSGDSVARAEIDVLPGHLDGENVLTRLAVVNVTIPHENVILPGLIHETSLITEGSFKQ